jgi:hypothetical protein
LPRCVLWSRCIVHVANRRWLATADDTEYNGSYSAPAAFVLRETIRIWALGGTMSDLAAAKALVAAYGYGPGSKWVWAVFVGLQTPGECLIPGDDLHSV